MSHPFFLSSLFFFLPFSLPFSPSLFLSFPHSRTHKIKAEQKPYKALAEALEVIPRTLVQNCGGNAIKTLTALRAKHVQGFHSWGVNGEKGTLADMKEYGIWEPLAVKSQTIKTAIEVCHRPILLEILFGNCIITFPDPDPFRQLNFPQLLSPSLSIFFLVCLLTSSS